MGYMEYVESTYNVLGIRRKRNGSVLRMLVLQHLGHNVCVWDRCHTGKAIVLRLACVNFTPVVIYSGFGPL